MIFSLSADNDITTHDAVPDPPDRLVAEVQGVALPGLERLKAKDLAGYSIQSLVTPELGKGLRGLLPRLLLFSGCHVRYLLDPLSGRTPKVINDQNALI